MKDKIFEYCKKAYIDTFNSEFEEYRKSHGGAKKILEEAERIAQKQAIKEALSKGVGNFPSEDVVTIWKNIYKVHIFRKSGLSSDEETIAKVISADQSWKKSSGHAFEGLVKEIANLSLTGTNIQVVLQKDLSLLLILLPLSSYSSPTEASYTSHNCLYKSQAARILLSSI